MQHVTSVYNRLFQIFSGFVIKHPAIGLFMFIIGMPALLLAAVAACSAVVIPIIWLFTGPTW